MRIRCYRLDDPRVHWQAAVATPCADCGLAVAVVPTAWQDLPLTTRFVCEACDERQRDTLLDIAPPPALAAAR